MAKQMYWNFIIVCSLFWATTTAIRSKRSTRCYGELGCFSNTSPFTNTDGLLPQRPELISTIFRLYTFRNGPNPEIISMDNPDDLARSGFDRQLPVKIVIHGFLQHGQVKWVRDMAAELLRKAPMNIISVDWGNGAGFPYSQAAANTRVVGAEVASLVKMLRDRVGMDMSDVHVIGHSLGAHVAGYAGARVPGVGRITGLDPAEPDYENTDVAVHLDKTDAVFVDIIHSDGSEFDYMSGFGMMDEVGHIDFYPNGGENQPGCQQSVSNFMSTAAEDGLEDAEDFLSCSHSRSIFLFLESINSPCPLYGHPCHDMASLETNEGNCMDCGSGGCPLMGYNADQTNARGKYYLKARATKPYCDAEDVLSCSHSRSIFLFLESINSPCPLYGHPCHDMASLETNEGNCMDCGSGGCPMMGYNADQTNARGKYYLKTRATKPYCGYTQHISIQFGSMPATTGNVRLTLVGADQTTDTIEINSGNNQFLGGQNRDVLWVDRERIDDIRSVRVKFVRQMGMLWWWTSYHTTPHHVSVYMVTVTDAETGNKKYFCGGNHAVLNGNTVELTRLTANPHDCRHIPAATYQ